MANDFDSIPNLDQVQNLDNIGVTNMSATKYIAFINNKQVLKTILTSELVNDANYTALGNTFNGAGQLVQLDAASKLPAVDGSQLTGITKAQVGLGNVKNIDTTDASNIATGTLANARLTADVTLMGNTFNGASQLVQLDVSSKLPAVDGSQLTGITKAQVGLGNVDNTSDANKPVSTAQAAAIAAEATARDAAIAVENTRAQAAESKLTTDLTAEVTRAEAAEAGLQTQITNLTGGGSGDSISKLRTDLTAETTRSEAAETDEATARAAAITAEATARAAADTTLQGNIDAEATARAAADVTNLDAAKAYADTKIAALVDNAPALLDTLGKIATELAADDSIVTALTKTVTDNLTAAKAYTDSAIATEVTARDAAIAAEATRAQAAEKVNSDAITAEATRAQAAEAAEATRAQAAEKVNSDAITAEATRAQAAEKVNSDAITAEATARTDADTAEATARAAAITAEATARTDADTILQGNIDTEVARAKAAEAAEATRAQAAESGIQAQINEIDTTIIDLNSAEMPAYENLAAGALVNIFTDIEGEGELVIKVRNANATDEVKPAMGFVLAGAQTGGTARVYYSGTNNMFTGLTVGVLYYLDTTNGQVTATPPVNSGNIIQIVGRAVNATTINCSERDYILIA